MNIINLTPHTININEVAIQPTTGVIARVTASTRTVEVVIVNGTPVDIVETTFGEVENLPEEVPGTYLIVSSLVRLAAKNRKDLLSPGEQIRNDAGQVVGCKNLTR
jgi:hypothetical protein